MTPRILFNDKNLTRTDIDLLSLIISLAMERNYCFANNQFLADYINTSKRTISDSLTRLKSLKYIIIKKENGKRRIYLNGEKIPLKRANDITKKCNQEVAEICDYNINNKYKKNYKSIDISSLPYWMEHPEVCKSEKSDDEELLRIKEMLNEFK